MSQRTMQRRRANRAARERAALLRRRRRIWLVLASVVLLVLTGTIGYTVYRAQRPDAAAATPAGVSADGAGVQIGSGPVTVELYSDFLCPACRAFENDARDDIDRLLAQRRIRLVYRPVAILDRLSTNEYSTRSAAGAGCAADAGKLLDYSKMLFDNQPAEGGAGHDDEALIRLAGTAGITGTEFGQCVRDGRYVDWVGQVTATMAPNGVRGTPTVFVAGTRLERPTGARLVAAVDAAAKGGPSQ
jgi:protein-disulfide isomerase